MYLLKLVDCRTTLSYCVWQCRGHYHNEICWLAQCTVSHVQSSPWFLSSPLRRASLLALAKSTYYAFIKSIKKFRNSRYPLIKFHQLRGLSHLEIPIALSNPNTLLVYNREFFLRTFSFVFSQSSHQGHTT